MEESKQTYLDEIIHNINSVPRSTRFGTLLHYKEYSKLPIMSTMLESLNNTVYKNNKLNNIGDALYNAHYIIGPNGEQLLYRSFDKINDTEGFKFLIESYYKYSNMTLEKLHRYDILIRRGLKDEITSNNPTYLNEIPMNKYLKYRENALKKSYNNLGLKNIKSDELNDDTVTNFMSSVYSVKAYKKFIKNEHEKKQNDDYNITTKMKNLRLGIFDKKFNINNNIKINLTNPINRQDIIANQFYFNYLYGKQTDKVMILGTDNDVSKYFEKYKSLFHRSGMLTLYNKISLPYNYIVWGYETNTIFMKRGLLSTNDINAIIIFPPNKFIFKFRYPQHDVANKYTFKGILEIPIKGTKQYTNKNPYDLYDEDIYISNTSKVLYIFESHNQYINSFNIYNQNIQVIAFGAVLPTTTVTYEEISQLYYLNETAHKQNQPILHFYIDNRNIYLDCVIICSYQSINELSLKYPNLQEIYLKKYPTQHLFYFSDDEKNNENDTILFGTIQPYPLFSIKGTFKLESAYETYTKNVIDTALKNNDINMYNEYNNLLKNRIQLYKLRKINRISKNNHIIGGSYESLHNSIYNIKYSNFNICSKYYNESLKILNFILNKYFVSKYEYLLHFYTNYIDTYKLFYISNYSMTIKIKKLQCKYKQQNIIMSNQIYFKYIPLSYGFYIHYDLTYNYAKQLKHNINICEISTNPVYFEVFEYFKLYLHNKYIKTIDLYTLNNNYIQMSIDDYDIYLNHILKQTTITKHYHNKQPLKKYDLLCLNLTIYPMKKNISESKYMYPFIKKQLTYLHTLNTGGTCIFYIHEIIHPTYVQIINDLYTKFKNIKILTSNLRQNIKIQGGLSLLCTNYGTYKRTKQDYNKLLKYIKQFNTQYYKHKYNDIVKFKKYLKKGSFDINKANMNTIKYIVKWCKKHEFPIV